MPRLVPALAWLILLGAATASAQTPQSGETTPAASSLGFLTRYDFHLSAAVVSSGDPRISAQARFGGDLDLVSFGATRATLLVDYEALFGDQVRLLEPIQGNYLIEASVTGGERSTRVGWVVRHVSRHLSDREQTRPVDWNELAVRLAFSAPAGRWTVSSRADVGVVFHERFVDYNWAAESDLLLRRPVRPRVGVFAHGFIEWIGLDQRIAGRRLQPAGRVEGGVSLGGRAGALELFAAGERRLDPYPLERRAAFWLVAGFRIVSR
jgi:hypothetical protein